MSDRFGTTEALRGQYSDGPMPEAPIVKGLCTDRFVGVYELLLSRLSSGVDIGASVAVTLDGRPVVDIWGGWADREARIRWDCDTITNVWSTTKTVTNLCLLILADRGEVNLDVPLAHYWPRFAVNGKDAICLRHVLAHTAGIPGWDQPLAIEDLYDWEKVTSLIEDQAPWWKPGTRSGYHASTQGYVIGEVIRRVTGQSVGTFLAREVAEPSGADFFIGVPAEQDHRISPVIPDEREFVACQTPDSGSHAGPSSISERTLGNPKLNSSIAWSERWRRAEIPAGNGHGNARSVARIQSIVACGGELGGRRYLSAKTCRHLLDEQSSGVDLVLGLPLRFGTGYGLSRLDGTALGPNPGTSFWFGAGGSLVLVDQDARMVVSYVMNRMDRNLLGDTRGFDIVDECYRALQIRNGSLDPRR